MAIAALSKSNARLYPRILLYRMRKSATSDSASAGLCALTGATASAVINRLTPSSTLKVDVKLVNVYVTVTDAQGGPVAGLKKENFTLQEDGREQTISVFDKESAVPLSIALAIDTSLSTRHDLPLEQASAKRFARTILRPVDALSVFGFSETVLQSTSYTSDLKRIDDGIDHIRLGAATALFDAVYLASRSLDHRQGRKVLVLITDGGDTVSKVDYKEAAARRRRGRMHRLQHYCGADREQRGTRNRRRARPHPALGRYGRQILLRDLHVAARRSFPPDQRRTPHPISAGILSVAAVV